MEETFNIEENREYLRVLAAQQIDARVRGKLDASDVVQDVLLKAQAKRDQFRGQTQAEWLGWLRRILQNQLATAYRRYAQQCRNVELEASVVGALSQSSDRLEAWLAASDSLPSVKAARNEQVLLLATALHSLPDDQREAIELHHLQGLSLADVGRVMQRTKPSVAGLIFRAVRGLRTKLSSLDSRSGDE